ncbi:phosphohydrolase [uncultured Cyclobacterium sp.]|uniref:phosphohydrolase n=1 Tax=uncultured Cyclobacterium sp. TaxID=453820 RepID=UPI0030EF2F78|tara:strand:- start:58424 stop:58930 length:507 start_codon:yes stop_codon:yes gene_type:complete
MLKKTAEYAIYSHQKVNHKYGEQDYDYHLKMVYEVAEKFSYLIAESERENVYCGCWVHDIIEDARETYNDVLQNTNETIADLAFALTNEKGKSRKERANDKYYQEMHEIPNAIFIKFCDRIANITHSKSQGSNMYEKYKKENDNFIQKTYRPELLDMIKYIDELLEKD